MRHISVLIILMLAGCAAHHTHAQKSDDTVITAIPVAGSVYMLESQGSGNIGVSAGEDGILIVDDKFEPLAGQIKNALRDLNPGTLKFVINTHWHNDHTGANAVFGRDATIIAHENVRKRLSTRQEIKLFNTVVEPHPKDALPVITFDNAVSIHFNGEEIKAVHFAHGHTDGDSVIFFTKSNVVHMGDHFFNGIYPFIDLDSGGNVQGMIDNVKQLIAIIPPGAKIIPGHGPLADIDDLKRFHDMLVQCADIVQQSIRDGKTLEEVKAAGLPASIEEQWGGGFLSTEKWLEIVYASYARQ
ncbi:MBL fold metallo-hydrolase [bacterium]|nr:MBL fold metallo-hydrolase [bacterium]